MAKEKITEEVVETVKHEPKTSVNKDGFKADEAIDSKDYFAFIAKSRNQA